MLSLFRSQESRDFEKAMDFLHCSRTLMGSAIETHRAIVEINSDESGELLALASVVKPAAVFLKKNLDSVARKIEAWKLQMQLYEPERYRKIERIINNAEKNITAAREKAVHIDHWMHIDMAALSPFF